MIHFQPVSALLPIPTTARYLPADYALRVDPESAIPTQEHRISIDTLTLSLHSTDHVLVGLHAYTNAERWHHRQLALPPVDQEMAVHCIELFDEHGIGQGSSDPVRYTYSEETSLLLIEVSEDQVVTRIRCLSCGICGLGVDGGLIEIWVQGLSSIRRQGSKL